MNTNQVEMLHSGYPCPEGPAEDAEEASTSHLCTECSLLPNEQEQLSQPVPVNILLNSTLIEPYDQAYDQVLREK